MSGLTEPANVRVLPISNYSKKVTLNGPGNKLIPVCRGTYKIPTVVTIYSRAEGFIDSALPSTGSNRYTWAHARLKVTVSDGNVSYTRDVVAGKPITVIGSIVAVEAYLTKDNVYLGINGGDPSLFPATVSADVYVNIVEGRPGPARDRTRGSEKSNGTTGSVIGPNIQPAFRAGVSNGPLPTILHSLSGFQESGSDLYVMLFDANGFAANYVNPDLTLRDGCEPVVQFKAFDGENFSYVFEGEDGMFFQHGCAAVFSSTPAFLTAVNAAGIIFVANWEVAEVNAAAALYASS